MAHGLDLGERWLGLQAAMYEAWFMAYLGEEIPRLGLADANA